MIYLNMNINDFFIQFPSLKNVSMNTCKEYDLDINEAKPFVTKEKVGILLNPKEERPLTIHIFRNEEINKEAISFFSNDLK